MQRHLIRATAIGAVFVSSAAFASPNMAIDLTLPEITQGQYHRPYVAVWVEDAKGETVKTLSLWVASDGHKWLKDIRRWWRKAGRDDLSFVDGIASATKPAGHYKLNWDLTDDAGKAIEVADYTLFIEVVREHGGRDLVRQAFDLTKGDFTTQLAATEETGVIDIRLSGVTR
ncbi:DUF2271 domain-containing protein [Shewanella acanthi]|uniref:DUF2271 domain-containing protein n=1 Tax=Shewanella acanthi TaxID=2864212 RepID=UPI001C65894F|nr:DUF2271 domain-containing protein [Shewanella acanthi]QYJ79661.1 DUF2271 domain-containing protein [Shewanella acanthi]